jgi:hypothetical protein
MRRAVTPPWLHSSDRHARRGREGAARGARAAGDAPRPKPLGVAARSARTALQVHHPLELGTALAEVVRPRATIVADRPWIQSQRDERQRLIAGVIVGSLRRLLCRRRAAAQRERRGNARGARAAHCGAARRGERKRKASASVRRARRWRLPRADGGLEGARGVEASWRRTTAVSNSLSVEENALSTAP